MERNACHRDRRARRLPACGQGDVEQRGGFLGIVVEQLIEVAHAVEHQLVWMLALESPILLHHRRMGGKVGVGLGHRLACGSLSGGEGYRMTVRSDRPEPGWRGKAGKVNTGRAARQVTTWDSLSGVQVSFVGPGTEGVDKRTGAVGNSGLSTGCRCASGLVYAGPATPSITQSCRPLGALSR